MLEIIRERIDELKKLEESLQAIEGDARIIEYKMLLREIDEANRQLNYAIESADIDTIKDWTPGRKSGQDEYWEGTTGIIRTKKTNRKIISDRFVKLYPFLAGKLAKFTLKDVEPQIRPEELEAVIAREEVFSYKTTTRLAPATPGPMIKKTKKTTKKVVA
jgi:hypothetical protein